MKVCDLSGPHHNKGFKNLNSRAEHRFRADPHSTNGFPGLQSVRVEVTLKFRLAECHGA